MAVALAEKGVPSGVILSGTDVPPKEKSGPSKLSDSLPEGTGFVPESLKTGDGSNFDEQKIREAAYFEWMANGRPFQTPRDKQKDWFAGKAILEDRVAGIPIGQRFLTWILYPV